MSQLSSKEPRILVVSNNPVSQIDNNGKTLSSFFSIFSNKNVAQLYFSDEMPNGAAINNFFKISDLDIIKSLLRRKYQCGTKISLTDLTKYHSNLKRCLLHELTNLKKFESARFVRELAWNSGKWNTLQLNSWLDIFNPELIFFCAGDSAFAYDIVEYIQRRYCCKLVIYITDDYILPRKTASPIWWLRRNYLLKKMEHIVHKADLFFTISPNMKKEYKKLFNKDSTVIMNIVDCLYRANAGGLKSSLILVYAGGLHYKRYRPLRLLGKAIKDYNDKNNKKKAFLKIYSTQPINRKLQALITIEGASKFCGGLSWDKLKSVLMETDILVHVESFDKRSIESTKLSISTKIPEYLSLGKPIFAVGPREVASIQYIQDASLCVSNPNEISIYLTRLLDDPNLRDALSRKALEKYERFHKKERVQNEFRAKIIELFQA